MIMRQLTLKVSKMEKWDIIIILIEGEYLKHYL